MIIGALGAVPPPVPSVMPLSTAMSALQGMVRNAYGSAPAPPTGIATRRPRIDGLLASATSAGRHRAVANMYPISATPGCCCRCRIGTRATAFATTPLELSDGPGRVCNPRSLVPDGCCTTAGAWRSKNQVCSTPNVQTTAAEASQIVGLHQIAKSKRQCPAPSSSRRTH